MVNLPNINIIGLTGMSGAGKTTVSDIFAENGFERINCDSIAREVVKPNTLCLKELSEKFGEEIIQVDGSLDRKKMSAIVFTNPEKREQLNELIYPYITYIVIRQVKELEKSGIKYVILDAPTLFESGIDDICDTIVSVVTEREHSISRIMSRDNLTREQAENRLSSQHDKSFYAERSTYCIENSGDKSELCEKTLILLDKIRSADGKN